MNRLGRFALLTLLVAVPAVAAPHGLTVPVEPD
jgi:hypothetical protein